MKTLIENLTSDLLPNQIFQTGFSFLIILKGNSLLKLDSNVLIFIMKWGTHESMEDNKFLLYPNKKICRSLTVANSC